MPTKLTKKITRETFSKNRNGQTLVVTLMPKDLLCFRAKGHKRKVYVSLGQCHNLAQLVAAESDYLDKLEKYKRRKNFGLKAKKPKRTQIPLSKFYYQSL